jgi:hypothetical protein
MKGDWLRLAFFIRDELGDIKRAVERVRRLRYRDNSIPGRGPERD